MGNESKTKTIKNSFSEKIQAERKILKLINEFNDPLKQVASLSLATIDDWLQRLNSPNQTQIEESVHRLLQIRNTLSTRHYHQRAQKDVVNAYSRLDNELKLLQDLLIAKSQCRVAQGHRL
jgi:adenosine deaminase